MRWLLVFGCVALALEIIPALTDVNYYIVIWNLISCMGRDVSAALLIVK
jgi:hypothetical protein